MLITSTFLALLKLLHSSRLAKRGLYRKWRPVSALNILYMQSEIATLAYKLGVLDTEDAQLSDLATKMNAHMCARDWDSLERLSKTDSRAKRRMELVCELRPLMKEYCMYVESFSYRRTGAQNT